MILEAMASRLKSRGWGLKNVAELKKKKNLVIKGLPKYTQVTGIGRAKQAVVEV